MFYMFPTELEICKAGVLYVPCRAREALRQCLPVQLQDSTFSSDAVQMEHDMSKVLS